VSLGGCTIRAIEGTHATGKTTLMHALAAHCGAHGVHVGTVDEPARSSPYIAIVRCGDPQVGRTRPAGRRGASGPAPRAVACVQRTVLHGDGGPSGLGFAHPSYRHSQCGWWTMSTSADDLSPLKQTLADLLAAFRKDAGLSQQQVADLVGYARVTVACAETGARMPGEGFWSRCDDLFAAAGRLRRAHAQLAQARKEFARQRTIRDQAQRDIRVIRWRAAGDPTSELAQPAADRPAGAAPAGAGEDGPVDRRELLRAGVAAGGGVASAAIARLVDALLSDSLVSAGLASADLPPTTLRGLRRRVDQMWYRYQAGLYQLVWAELPDLLRVVRTLGGRGELPTATVADLASRSFQLAASLAYKAGDPTMGLLAAERGLAAAAQTGDRLLGGVAVTRVAHGLRGTGRDELAADLSLRAAASLESPQRGDRPGRLSVHGALLLHAAMATAHRRDVPTCHSLLDEAGATGRRSGETNHYWTAFGPANVAAWTVAIQLRLGRAPEALAAADRVHLDQLPVAERQGHFLLDKANAHSQCGHLGDAVSTLLAAEHAAPDEVHSLPAARRLIADMLPRVRGTAHRPLHELAGRIGLPA
jgi:transcriptional regulator with XRE-family HTH domain